MKIGGTKGVQLFTAFTSNSNAFRRNSRFDSRSFLRFDSTVLLIFHVDFRFVSCLFVNRIDFLNGMCFRQRTSKSMKFLFC